MNSSIADAIKGMTGPEIVAYLGGVKWKATDADPKPLAPSDEGYGAYYNEVRDQGVGFIPGTWDEVRYLWNTGVIDDDTYRVAYSQFLSGAAPAAPPAADSAAADTAEGSAAADTSSGGRPASPEDGPDEGKRLSFAPAT